MQIRIGWLVLGVLVIYSGGCNSQPGQISASQTNAARTPTVSNPNQNSPQAGASPMSPGSSPGTAASAGSGACALLQNSEISAVQRAEVQSQTPSNRSSDTLAISQCYYTAFSTDKKSNLSVHLEISQRDPNSSNRNGVKDLWKSFEEAKASRKKEKPEPVSGVGEGAFWVGNDKVGALYVLKQDRVVRISLGGPDTREGKIQKSKALVLKVLPRLG